MQVTGHQQQSSQFASKNIQSISKLGDILPVIAGHWFLSYF